MDLKRLGELKMADGKNRVLGLMAFLFAVTLGLVFIDAGSDVLNAGSGFAGAALGVANLDSNAGITGALVVSESSLGSFMAAPEVADAAVSTSSLSTITGVS
ncbi:hypothetical protein HYY72_00160 [Candidatus Woesearchaeota archaeon]|nr:hypothetical protein [Candidatus Woesearchaeota archaeon]